MDRGLANIMSWQKKRDSSGFCLSSLKRAGADTDQCSAGQWFRSGTEVGQADLCPRQKRLSGLGVPHSAAELPANRSGPGVRHRRPLHLTRANCAYHRPEWNRFLKSGHLTCKPGFRDSLGEADLDVLGRRPLAAAARARGAPWAMAAPVPLPPSLICPCVTLCCLLNAFWPLL